MTDCARLCTHHPTPFPTSVYWGPVSPQLNPSLVLVVFFRASGCISISVLLIDGEEDRNAREGSGYISSYSLTQ